MPYQFLAERNQLQGQSNSFFASDLSKSRPWVNKVGIGQYLATCSLALILKCFASHLQKPEDKPIRVASKQRAQGQENQEHFAPDGRQTADIVKDEKGQEATWPSSQIQGDCQSARKGSVRRPDKASQNEKNGEIQETKKKDERGKVQGKEVQTNQGQAPQLGDKEIGNQTDKYEPDLDSEGGWDCSLTKEKVTRRDGQGKEKGSSPPIPWKRASYLLWRS